MDSDMTQEAGGGGGDPTQGRNERADAEATTTMTNDESALLLTQLPSQSNGGDLLRGELWATQGTVRDAVRAAEAEWRGLDPEASPPPMDHGREFFGTRYVMCACVERSLER